MEGYIYADPPPALDAALKAWLRAGARRRPHRDAETAKTKGKPTRVGRGLTLQGADRGGGNPVAVERLAAKTKSVLPIGQLSSPTPD
jgi:hypothetical protein